MDLKDRIQMKKAALKGMKAALPLVLAAAPFAGEAKEADARPENKELKMTNTFIPEPKVMPVRFSPKASTTVETAIQGGYKELASAAFETVKEHEGYMPHLYLDVGGLIHGGYGTNIDRWEDFAKVNFEHSSGKSLTAEEKRAYYQSIQSMKPKFKTNGDPKRPYNHSANVYKGHFKYMAPKSEWVNVCKRDIEERFIPQVEQTLGKEGVSFSKMPLPLQEVLVDITYSTGNLSSTKWPKLYDGMKKTDYDKMKDNVSRSIVGETRNNWAKEKVVAAANKKNNKNYLIPNTSQKMAYRSGGRGQ